MADSGQVRCPRCDAENRSGRALCYLCGRSLDDAEPVRAALPAPTLWEVDRLLPFRIGSLLLLVVLAVVLLWTWRVAPGLAIALAVFSAIALVITGAVSGHARDRPATALEHGAESGQARKRPPSVLESIGNFLMWSVLLLGVAIASIVAFCVTCTGIAFIGFLDSGAFGRIMLVLGVIGGSAAWFAVVISLTRSIMRARDRDRPPSRDKPPFDREF